MKKLCNYILIGVLCLIPTITFAKVTCTNGDYNANVEIESNTINLADYEKINITSDYEISDIRYSVSDKTVVGIINDTIYPIKSGKTLIDISIYFKNEDNKEITCKTNLDIEVLSNNASLKSLTLQEYDLSEIFRSSSHRYEFSLPYSTNEINIIAVPDDETSKIKGDGHKTLKDGQNIFNIIVTSKDNTKEVYTLSIIKSEPDNDKTLRSLYIEGYSLNPKFSNEIKEYTLNVANDIDSVSLVATPNSEVAKVLGDGTLRLATGKNKFYLKVIAENKESETYTINIIKSSGTSKLSSLKIEGYDIEPIFDTETFNYTLTVNNDVNKLNINAKAYSNDQVEILGNDDLLVGENTIIIRVSNKDKSATTYKLTVTKLSKKEEELISKNNILTKVLLVIFIVSVVINGIFILIFIKNNFKRSRKNKEIMKKINKIKNKGK